MAVARHYFCDGPDCGSRPEGPPNNVEILSLPPQLPVQWIIVTYWGAHESRDHHFCSWSCVMKYAAGVPHTDSLEEWLIVDDGELDDDLDDPPEDFPGE